MNRLQIEWRRLYLPDPLEASAERVQQLIDPAMRVRAVVVELTGPANWEVLGKLWQGVQTELEWPAPAIAVSGVDGLQLWFSLAEPILAARGQAFAAALVERFLPDVASKRIRLWPAITAPKPGSALHARPVPAEQGSSGNWSAFIAPDLAPIFADTPWLDIPPGEEGQTNLLRGLRSLAPAAWEAAEALLMPFAGRAPIDDEDGRAAPVRPTPAPPVESPSAAAADDDPRRFLLRVMSDVATPLALRIEAARALLSK